MMNGFTFQTTGSLSSIEHGIEVEETCIPERLMIDDVVEASEDEFVRYTFEGW